MNEIFDNIENFDEYFEYLDLLKWFFHYKAIILRIILF